MPKPEPPKIFLPDRFDKMTTELSDGTIVTIDNDVDENGNAIIVADNAPSKSQASPLVGGHKDKVNKDVIVEVTPSRPGAEDETQHRLADDRASTKPKPAQKDSADAIVIAAAAEQKQKPVSKAERRRLIKEELMKMAANDKPVYYQRRMY